MKSENTDITAVIKFGGHALDDPAIRASFIGDMRLSQEKGERLALVHGGGPQINSLLQRLDIKSSFVNGLRVTSPETLEVAEMVLCGKTNKEIARMLQKDGIKSAGISGEDGNTLIAEQLDEKLGLVGKIIRVNPSLILTLLNGGFLPVIAPLAVDENENPLNVNADTAAAHIAGCLHAPWFVLISDVPGVLDENGKLMPTLSVEEINAMKEAGIIHGGMIPKVDACLYALERGCGNAIIMDGSKNSNLSGLFEKGMASGTIIRNIQENAD